MSIPFFACEEHVFSYRGDGTADNTVFGRKVHVSLLGDCYLDVSSKYRLSPDFHVSSWRAVPDLQSYEGVPGNAETTYHLVRRAFRSVFAPSWDKAIEFANASIYVTYCFCLDSGGENMFTHLARNEIASCPFVSIWVVFCFLHAYHNSVARCAFHWELTV